jgi:hypothetical protein
LIDYKNKTLKELEIEKIKELVDGKYLNLKLPCEYEDSVFYFNCNIDNSESPIFYGNTRYRINVYVFDENLNLVNGDDLCYM